MRRPSLRLIPVLLCLVALTTAYERTRTNVAMANAANNFLALLTPEQKPRYAAMVVEQAGRTVTRGRIYLMDAEGKPKAFNARLGISDGSNTELIVSPNSTDADALKEGAAIITGTVTQGSASTPARSGATGPRMVF